MRLLVDGVFFQLASSGIARVWSSLLPRLVARGNLELFVLDRGGAPDVVGATMVPFPSYRDRYTADDSLLLQKICDHFAIDVFTTTYYTSPLSIPMLLLIYDMIPEHFDFDLTQRFWMEKEIAISFARRFIAISEATKRDLLTFYPEIPTACVEVAYPGYDPEIFRPQSEEAVRAFRAKIGFARPYMLLVGSREQHKGYKNAKLFFEACASLGDDGFDVLCIGGEPDIDGPCRDMMPDSVKVARLTASDEDLALAYAGAIALVYPSLYEGFGLPVLEAMASGCPVITTTAGSLAEIAIGDCCLTIDGTSVKQMKEALLEVRRPERRQALVTSGLARATAFDWTAMIDAIERQTAALHENHQAGLYQSFFSEWRVLRDIQGSVDIEPIL